MTHVGPRRYCHMTHVGLGVARGPLAPQLRRPPEEGGNALIKNSGLHTTCASNDNRY